MWQMARQAAVTNLVGKPCNTVCSGTKTAWRNDFSIVAVGWVDHDSALLKALHGLSHLVAVGGEKARDPLS
jgi:hypothetical protein